MKKIIFLFVSLSFVLFLSCEDRNTDANKTSQNPIKNKYVTVEFMALDSLPVTANIYEISKDSPVIVLCHQARFNKFEYAGIAEELNKLGFNCIAIDQRSGGPIGDQVNETTIRAKQLGKDIDYIDAEPDIIAAVEYAVNKYNSPIVLWGSSYSSTLALYIAAENSNVKAVVSFSPGNYMAEYKGSLIDVLEGFNKPMFVTSSKKEAPYVEELFEKVQLANNQILFVPEGRGHHGSRALWKTQNGGEEYWNAIVSFLKNLKTEL